MSEVAEVRIPRDTVNDDFVTIVGWFRQSGALIQPRERLLSIETSKSIVEIEAETQGYLEILHPAGAEVPVGELIGKLHPSPVTVAQTAAPAQAGSNTESSSKIRFSKKAQVLIQEQGIDPAVFDGQGSVRESDVLAYIEAQHQATQAQKPVQETEPAPSSISPIPASVATREGGIFQKVKGFFADAQSSAQDRGRSVIGLGFNYLFRNYLLGWLARISPLGLNLLVHRLRGVKLGKGVYIDPTSVIETAYPENITIGNDVRVTAYAVIMTHIKAPHHLRATGIMPLVIKPVVLEDHCFIGVNAVIMPGITVGKGAVVTSGSVVTTNVLPYTMVAGNPAKVVKRFPPPKTS